MPVWHVGHVPLPLILERSHQFMECFGGQFCSLILSEATFVPVASLAFVAPAHDSRQQHRQWKRTPRQSKEKKEKKEKNKWKEKKHEYKQSNQRGKCWRLKWRDVANTEAGQSKFQFDYCKCCERWEARFQNVANAMGKSNLVNTGIRMLFFNSFHAATLLQIPQNRSNPETKETSWNCSIISFLTNLCKQCVSVFQRVMPPMCSRVTRWYSHRNSLPTLGLCVSWYIDMKNSQTCVTRRNANIEMHWSNVIMSWCHAMQMLWWGLPVGGGRVLRKRRTLPESRWERRGRGRFDEKRKIIEKEKRT